MIEPQFRKRRRSANQKPCRHGLTSVELIISAILLTTVMSFVTTICFQVNLVWKDINHHRVAMGELSNQLEELTLLSLQDAPTAIEDLKPSPECARSLRNPTLNGELIDDQFGTRIVLRINWDRRNPGKPVELVGWIVSDQPESTESSESTESTEKAVGGIESIQDELTSGVAAVRESNLDTVEIATSTEATR